MITTGQNLWLIGLACAWAVVLFGMFVIGRPDQKNEHRIPKWARLGSSFILMAAAWIWCVSSGPGMLGGFSLWIALGMTLGFLGDVFLSAVLPFVTQPVLFGIGAFGLGHVAYIAGLITIGSQIGLGLRWIVLGIWLLIGAVGWYVVIWRGAKGKPSVLHLAALPYALLLSTTVGVATSLSLQWSAFVPLAIGAALFLFSDLLVAAVRFNHAFFPLIGDVVWLTYGPGQMLIVYTAGWVVQSMIG